MIHSGYEILPHTADIRLRIKAASLEELFLTSLQAMAQVQKKGFCSDRKDNPIRKEVSCQATDSTFLLVDFLSEVLTMSHICKAIFCHAEFVQFSDRTLTAEITGYAADEWEEDIKAVTYHEAQIELNDKQEYSTVIVLDI